MEILECRVRGPHRLEEGEHLSQAGTKSNGNGGSAGVNLEMSGRSDKLDEEFERY